MSAFTTLAQRHEAPLYTYFVRQLGQEKGASELVVEAFRRAILSDRPPDQDHRFLPRIYSIARELCQGHRPARSSRKGKSTAGDERSHFLDGLADLPSDRREVYLLREVAGLGFADIAEVTNATRLDVKARLLEALEALQRRLTDTPKRATPDGHHGL